MHDRTLNSVRGSIAALIVASGCTTQALPQLEEPLALYRQNRLEEALPLLERVAARSGRHAEAHTWLAETYRRLGRKDDAIARARMALDLDQCNSFAHTVVADASRSRDGAADTTWAHLMQAVECDPTDGNAWISIWGEAIRRQRPDLVERSHRRLVETGFLTETALAFGRWLLRTLPQNAILITNGDMDTYPALAVQETEEFRTDVTVVERGLLNVPWALRFLRDHARLSFPFTNAQIDSLAEFEKARGHAVTVSEQVFQAWIDQKESGALRRPLCVAVTVDESYVSSVKRDLQYAGPFSVWQPAGGIGGPDTAAMRASLEHLAEDDFSGPWISEQDRSPVRRVFTNQLTARVTGMALLYAESLIEAKRFAEAERVLQWTEQFESHSELGPASAPAIAGLRERIRLPS